MNNVFLKINSRAVILIMALVTFFLLPDILEARRGGRSFGGSRRSFGRKSTSSKRGSSFGNKSSRSKSTSARRGSFGKNATPTQRMSAFGGKQLSSKKAYTSKYGAPRKTTTQTIPTKTAGGKSVNTNYRVHSYGGFGFGSGFMTGYMLGTIPWYWSTPFHPAFYYRAPQYHKAEDGSVDVYPGTFNWGKLFAGIIIIGGVGFVVFRVVRNSRRRRDDETYSPGRGSFG
jgi:hypothetical protein